nr:hypothetical protein [Paucilactobacillus hokkaidonensis]
MSATSLQSVHAAGLVDETVNNKHEFSKYPVNNYQLDYFVDSSWDWLPWNWGDGIGKSVMYAIYAITNFLWLISVYLSYATGYLIQQAYSLDFIKDTTDAIGKNMQLLAGVSKNGFSADGFYPGMLLLLILVLGVYVAYTGLIKRESSKAISAVANFIVIFILSASFIAYSPDYIGKINQFSADMSTSALNTGSKMIMQNKQSTSKNGLMRFVKRYSTFKSNSRGRYYSLAILISRRLARIASTNWSKLIRSRTKVKIEQRSSRLKLKIKKTTIYQRSKRFNV